MYTTIKVSSELRLLLESMKTRTSESYEDVIEDLVEDHLSLNPAFKKSIDKARREIAAGRFTALADLKRGMTRHV